jgi:hypothetical protein
VEAALVAVAFVLALGLMVRGLGGERPEPPSTLSTFPSVSPYPRACGGAPPLATVVPRQPPLATVVPGQPTLRIFAFRRAEVLPALPPPGQSGADYRLTLTRGAGGRWTSVLRAPEVLPEGREGAALTVTLVVPWTELASRYSAVNLVVR